LAREINMKNFSLNNNTIIIGAGNLGQAVAIGRVDISVTISNLRSKTDDIFIHDIDKRKRDNFKKYQNIKFIENLSDVLKNFKIVILAVKPKDYKVVCKNIKDYIKKDTIIMSLIAGIKINEIKKEFFDDVKIVRVMTNINVQRAIGINFIYINNRINNSDRKKIDLFWNQLGYTRHLKSETNIDKFTALTGSGPAYFIYFCECLVKAFKKFGLTDQDANNYVSWLFNGTASISNPRNRKFSQITKMVASKGGTTEEALKILQTSNFEKTIEKAIRKAHLKSKNILNKKNG
tara:strand:- start:80866 stop:81738 length:873 start_codon:yes stop_codon:yes gene_type:complete